MNPEAEKWRVFLNAKTRDELNILAKQLKISGFRKLSKDLLIESILQTGQNEKLVSILAPSWWTRYHNHVYGLATLIGLGLTILFFVWPKLPGVGSTRSGQPSIPITDRQNERSETQPQATSTPSTVEAEEARVASSAQAFSSISIEEYFSRWFEGTDLQRDQLEKEMIGKTVIWTGRIISIRSADDGGVRVIVEPPNDKSPASAFLTFDTSQRMDFLKLKEKQVIRFTGVIDRFVASPFLEKCKLLRVIE
jgi:hypothetical protein